VKLKEFVELDAMLKKEVEAYAAAEKLSLDQLLELSLSEWLKLLATEINQLAFVIENV